MGWQRKETGTPEVLSKCYGLRACEIVDKARFIKANELDHSITIRGKGDRVRTIHLRPSDYLTIVDWYAHPTTISYSTLWRRLGKTHAGRRRRYESLPADATFEDAIALGEELGHGVGTAMKHYNRKRLETIKQGRLLQNLPS